MSICLPIKRCWVPDIIKAYWNTWASMWALNIWWLCNSSCVWQKLSLIATQKSSDTEKLFLGLWKVWITLASLMSADAVTRQQAKLLKWLLSQYSPIRILHSVGKRSSLFFSVKRWLSALGSKQLWFLFCMSLAANHKLCVMLPLFTEIEYQPPNCIRIMSFPWETENTCTKSSAAHLGKESSFFPCRQATHLWHQIQFMHISPLLLSLAAHMPFHVPKPKRQLSCQIFWQSG